MTRLFLPFTLALSLSACTSDPLTGPLEPRIGRDECAECGMLISDGACASALLIEQNGSAGQGDGGGGRGVKESVVFDDIGCMLDYLPKTKGAHVEHFVRDHAQRRWVAGSTAWIVAASGLHTPMGSGMVAFADRAAADRLAHESGGRVFPGASLLEAPATARTLPPSAK
ncbi:MAG: nitrous oxide reductase accessory protein NosL [Phycisphaerales bacterium]